jgi:hypothetical protein
MLTETLRHVTEGHDTADVIAARQLLAGSG